MIYFYKKTFKISFPPINYPVIACRMLSLLALPGKINYSIVNELEKKKKKLFFFFFFIIFLYLYVYLFYFILYIIYIFIFIL